MIKIVKATGNIEITLIAIEMGNDWNISVYGGDTPHIGAVALGIPRASLSDITKVSSSASLLTVSGHMEDELVLPVAKKVAKALNAISVIACGIHKENISVKEINIIVNVVNELIDEFIVKVEKP